MTRFGSRSTAATVAALYLATGAAAPAEASPRLCLGLFGDRSIIELGVARDRLATTGYGPLAGQTYSPRARDIHCFGVKPLPVSGSYVTRRDGSVVVTLNQILLTGEGTDSCGRTVYTLLLHRPRLGGTVCIGEPVSDSTSCGPVRLVTCPPPP